MYLGTRYSYRCPPRASLPRKPRKCRRKMSANPRASATQALTGCDVRGKKVLMVGAGGIGCELVKNLVLTGFEDITVIDLDTIDYSNLNRQFLFRNADVDHSKAEVARRTALAFPHSPALKIVAEHANVIADERFSFDFFEGFDIVLNGLDNIAARRHVNRMCLATGTPLVESGTEGSAGQVRAIFKGVACYECIPAREKKTYAVCTVRNTPSEPVHCIHWVTTLLFPKLFGGQETDLLDASQGGEEGAPTPPPLARAAGESAAAFARRVFSAVFEADIERLIRMTDLWEERPDRPNRAAHKPSAPIHLSRLNLPDNTATARAMREHHRVWSLEESAAVFLATLSTLLERPAAFEFDKDDDEAMDCVAAASNLRSSVFRIPLQSRFDAKGIAGSIVTAVATTNAVIAGFIVFEALKVLRGAYDACRYCNLHAKPLGKSNKLMNGSSLDPPRRECMACAKPEVVRCMRPWTLTLDTTAFTVGELIDRVAMKHLSLSTPTIDINLEGVAGFPLCDGGPLDPDEDAEEIARFARYRAIKLAELPHPVGTGSMLRFEDYKSSAAMLLVVRHTALDPEAAPSGFLVESPAAEGPAEGTTLNGKRPREVDNEVEDEPRGDEAEDVGGDSDGCEMFDSQPASWPQGVQNTEREGM